MSSGSSRFTSAKKPRERPTLVAFCEGRTEAQYLQEWGRRLRDKVIVRAFESEGVPLTLAEKAVKFRNAELRAGVNPLLLSVWCVGDQDSHPNLVEALKLAKENEIEFALSVPCMELWIVLHFQDQTANIDRFKVQSLSKSIVNCHKNLSSSTLVDLIENYPDARTRAIALEKKHAGDGSGDMANPRSGLWRLVDQLQSY